MSSTGKSSNPAAEEKKLARVFGMEFFGIYELYVKKVERKGHTAEEVDTVIAWLTGYAPEDLHAFGGTGVTLEQFFDRAPHLNDNAAHIKGVICGVRVEDIEHPLMRKIRYMDKLVDEVARGKKMSSILRGSAG